MGHWFFYPALSKRTCINRDLRLDVGSRVPCSVVLRHRPLALLVAALAVAGLSACSDDDDPPPSQLEALRDLVGREPDLYEEYEAVA